MPQLVNLTLNNGTRFIKHEKGQEMFIFGVRSGHVVSISVGSPQIGYYRTVLGGDANETMAWGAVPERATTYRKSALDTVQHDAVHELGMTYGDHEHFDSRRGSEYDGIGVLPLLIPKLSTGEVYAIMVLAKSTAT
jgi:hypothetical protein